MAVLGPQIVHIFKCISSLLLAHISCTFSYNEPFNMSIGL